MKNLSRKQFCALALITFMSVPAFAGAPVCKVRTMGGGSLGLTVSFWKKVSAASLEECQEAAASLVGETENWEDPSGRAPQYYRPWKAWYKWQADGETTKGSFTADDVFAGPSQ